MSRKKKIILICSLPFALGLALLAWPLYPLQLKKVTIVTTSTTTWSKYQRLTRLLALGMEPSEVKRILGEPTRTDKVARGEVWTYLEDDATTGWSYVAHFRVENTTEAAITTPKLCFVENIEHVLFPKSKRFQMGEKLR